MGCHLEEFLTAFFWWGGHVECQGARGEYVFFALAQRVFLSFFYFFGGATCMARGALFYIIILTSAVSSANLG